MSGIIYGAHNEGYRKLALTAMWSSRARTAVAMVDVGFNNKDLGGTFATMYGVQNWRLAAR